MSGLERWAVGLGLLVASLVGGEHAVGAAPCTGGQLLDPVALGFQDGAHGQPRSACLRSSLSLGGGGTIIAEPRNFYGNIRVEGVLAGRWLLTPDVELFGAVELVRWQTVIASLSADHLGLGHTALGAALTLARGDDGVLTLAAFTTLPTALGLYQRTWPFALDVGVAATKDLDPALEVHGWLGARSSVGAGVVADPRAGLALDAGAAWRVFAPFAVVLDVEGSLGYRAPLDHLALGLGLRVAPTDEVTLELLGKLPVAGDERALASAYLGVSWAPVVGRR